jgi:hypothetical protein
VRFDEFHDDFVDLDKVIIDDRPIHVIDNQVVADVMPDVA